MGLAATPASAAAAPFRESPTSLIRTAEARSVKEMIDPTTVGLPGRSVVAKEVRDCAAEVVLGAGRAGSWDGRFSFLLKGEAWG